MKELLVGVAMLIMTMAFYIPMQGIDVGDATDFPAAALYFMLGLSLIQCFRAVIAMKNKSVLDKGTDKKSFPFLRVGIAIILMVLYFAVLDIIGFYVSGFLFMLTVFVTYGKFRTPKYIGISVLSSASFMTVLFLLFNVLLTVQTPRGLIM